MFNPGLIFAYMVKIGRLDTASMGVENPAGYDDVLREPVLVDSDGDGVGEPRRREILVSLPAQISTASWEQLRLSAGGLAPESEIAICFDRDDLDEAGLIDVSTGESVLRLSDRLVSIEDMDGVPIITFPNDPNEDHYRTPLQATSVRPTGFMGSENLVDIIFRQEDASTRFGR